MLDFRHPNTWSQVNDAARGAIPDHAIQLLDERDRAVEDALTTATATPITVLDTSANQSGTGNFVSISLSGATPGLYLVTAHTGVSVTGPFSPGWTVSLTLNETAHGATDQDLNSYILAGTFSQTTLSVADFLVVTPAITTLTASWAVHGGASASSTYIGMSAVLVRSS